MHVTLAMGLQYNSYRGAEMLSAKTEGAGFDLNAGVGNEVIDAESMSVMDVEAIKSSPSLVDWVSNKHFEYLAYNLHAGLVLLPQIGHQVDMQV